MKSLLLLIIQRGWIGLSGLVSTILIARSLSAPMQGWYYAFLSLVVLHSLFELGLSVILVQISSKFFFSLQWTKQGAVQGDNRKAFEALINRTVRFYFFLAVVFFLVLLPAGIVFFELSQDVIDLAADQWLAPWVSLVVVTSLMIISLPFMSIIEGTGRVLEVVTVKLAYGVIGSLTCWATLASGGGLWATIMMPLSLVIVVSVWLKTRYSNLLSVALGRLTVGFTWRRDIWPQQWRFGVGWSANYFLTQIYTPILFYMSGAVVAGQMGLSMAIANMLAILAHSWVSRHVSAMSHAVLDRDWLGLDRIFKQDFYWSTSFFLLCAAALCLIQQSLQTTEYGTRMLGGLQFAGLLAIALINHFLGMLAAYLRSYGEEPLVWVLVAGALAIVPIALWAVSIWGVSGFIATILINQLVWMLPTSLVIWRRTSAKCRLKLTTEYDSGQSNDYAALLKGASI